MKRFLSSITVALASYAGTNVWIPLGPYGATVSTLVADPTNPGTLYAGTGYGGGLYKTTDGGANWTLLNPELGPAYLAIDPQNTNTIYAGVPGTGNSGAWMFKSTDGGASFNLSNSGLEAVDFSASLTVDPQNSGTVYAVVYAMVPCTQSTGCTSTQVVKSTDGGTHWSVASSGLPAGDSQITALAIDPQDSRVLYAGLYGPNGVTSGIFTSTTGGASWSPLNLSVPVCCKQALAIDPVNRDTLYAASNGGIVRISATTGTILSTTALGGGTILSIAIDQRNPGSVYAVTEGGSSSVFKSTDSGNTWKATAYASPIYGDSVALAADPLNSGTVYVGTSYGVIKTIDGGASWTDVSHGMHGITVESVTVDPHNSGTLYATDNGIRVLKTTDGGKNWTGLQGLPSGLSFIGPVTVTVDTQDSNTLYTVSSTGVWKSGDGGASWNEVGQPSLAAIRGFALDRQNPGTLYVLAGIQVPGQDCCPTGVFKSTDGGTNWAMKASLEEGNSTTLLVIDPENSSTLYAAGAYRGTISKSTDGGVTWIDSLLLPPEAFTTEDDDSWAIVKSLAVDPRNSNVVYVSGNGGIFKSTDGSATWTTMNVGLTPHVCTKCYAPDAVQSLIVDPQTGALYAVSTGGGGILKSRDGGSTWVPVNDGLAGANTLALDPNNPSRLYAGGAGVYTMTVAPEIRAR